MTAAGEHQGDGLDSLYVERPTGFEMVPDALWYGTGLSPKAVVAYLALSKAGAREGKGFPGRNWLAAAMGGPEGPLSLPTVDARLDELVTAGWLLITPRFGRGGQVTSHYRLLWRPLESADDPRYQRWLAEVEGFNEQMADRAATNLARRRAEAQRDGKPMPEPREPRGTRRAAWAPPNPAKETWPGEGGQETLAPGAKETCPLGAKETWPLNPYLQTTPTGTHTSRGKPRLAEPNDGLLPLDGVTVPPPAPQPEPPVTFEDFYAVYPRKEAPKAARKAWAKAVQETHPQVILDGARRFAADPNLPPPEESRYIPLPTTWLNQGRWASAPLPPRGGPQGRAGWQAEVDRQRAVRAEYAARAEAGEFGPHLALPPAPPNPDPWRLDP